VVREEVKGKVDYVRKPVTKCTVDQVAAWHKAHNRPKDETVRFPGVLALVEDLAPFGADITIESAMVLRAEKKA